MGKKAKVEQAWEPAHQALKRLYPFHGGYYATKLMLAEMLKDGELEATAGQYWTSTQPTLTAAWQDRAHAEITANVVLDASDFGWSRHWAEDLTNWRWQDNRFVLTRRKKPAERAFLVDVAFRHDQVTAIMPSNRRGIGGRQIRANDWAKTASR